MIYRSFVLPLSVAEICHFFDLRVDEEFSFWKMPCISFPMRDRKKRHESKIVALDDTYKMRPRLFFFFSSFFFSFSMRDRKKRHESKNVARHETYKMIYSFVILSLFVAEIGHFFDLRVDEESISGKCLVSRFRCEIGKKDTNPKLLPSARPTK